MWNPYKQCGKVSIDEASHKWQKNHGTTWEVHKMLAFLNVMNTTYFARTEKQVKLFFFLDKYSLKRNKKSYILC